MNLTILGFILVAGHMILASPIKNVCEKFENDQGNDGADYYQALVKHVIAPIHKVGMMHYALKLEDEIIVNGSRQFSQKDCQKIKILDSCLDGVEALKIVEINQWKDYEDIVRGYVLSPIYDAKLYDIYEQYEDLAIPSKDVEYTKKTCINLSKDI